MIPFRKILLLSFLLYGCILDHLGSTTWVTYESGEPVEYIHYMPYGELWVDQHTTGYSERYRFTGKERDSESGYDYFGARYYSSTLPMWLSVDPLLDKYPELSPYAYCSWNPIKYVDPNGMWVESAWDIANVTMGINSLSTNIREHNIGGAIIDGVGLALDLGAAVLPVVPGGASATIKAIRTADKTSDALKTGRKIIPNGGKAKPHGGFKHNAAIDTYIENLPVDAINIRKNQSQVDVNGNKVGNNRPDVQYDFDNTHINVEFDTKPINGEKHQQTILKNDPNATVILNNITKYE